MSFRPLLSGKAPDDLNLLRFPLIASPKIDGIRALITQDGPVTRKLEPIPNRHINEMLRKLPVGFDGEITSGVMTDEKVWNRTQSAVMSFEGEPEFQFHVFDDFSDPDLPFEKRLNRIYERIRHCPHLYCTALAQDVINTVPDLLAYEQRQVDNGFEGVMVRDPQGPYKFGRSTTSQGILLKMKRWHDAEALIVDVKERMHNGNEIEIDALGYAKRATKKEGKTGRGDLGAFICRAFLNDSGTGYKRPPCTFTTTVEFDLGSGFTDADRMNLWNEPPIGALAKFKYQGLTPDNKPRFPIFLGFRDRRD